jgi:hypothetical protein
MKYEINMKSSNMKFHENQVAPCEQAGGQTDRKTDMT